MHDLGRMVQRGIKGKEPLPPPFPEWGVRGMHLYPGSVHLFAGMAGTFKTMVVNAAVINMGVPTFMFSTDSDDLTQASRLLAQASGTTVEQARIMAIKDQQRAATLLRERYGHIKWCFLSDPSGDDVWNHLYAYATRYGDWPRVVVIDILSDVVFENAESEWAALRGAMKQFNIVARETNAAVILVHHCTEGARTTDMTPCPSRDQIMGKDMRHPVLVVTFGKDSNDDLHAACVKLRHGKADASGRSSFRMFVDPTTSRVADYDPRLRTLVRPVVSWGGWDPGEDDDE